jgi:hypothetical protein
MAVPFGFSAGDFIAGIKLLKSAFDSLSDARGAKADYSELRQTLGALEKALDAAGQFTTLQHQAAVGDEVANCRECVNEFLAGFKKFELLKTGRGRRGRVILRLDRCNGRCVRKTTCESSRSIWRRTSVLYSYNWQFFRCKHNPTS